MPKDKKPPEPNIETGKHKSPPLLDVPKIEWTFSFKFYQQIKSFGLDRVKPSWFSSLLDRFKELSHIEIEYFNSNHALKQNCRYHDIDWQAKNIPISRRELNWIPPEYLNNEIDYPFVQFHISKAHGRVVGFWNENSTLFYIVLLDPHHNIQPSSYNDYKINDCNVLSCQYTSLLKDISDIKPESKKCEECSVYENVKKLPTKTNQTNAVLLFLDDSYLEELKNKLNDYSIEGIIELGLLAD